MYSTTTNGPGDLRAAAQHRRNVDRMVQALWACPSCCRVVSLHGHTTNCDQREG